MSDPRAQATWIEEAKRNAGLLIALGVFELLIGFVAIGSPLVTGFAIAFMIGSVLVLAGAVRAVSALKAGSFGTGVLALMGGVVALAVGLVLLLRPGTGVAFITWILAIYFVADGVARLAMGIRMRGQPGTGWEVFGGLVSVTLGILIYVHWPLSGAWAIGVLIGVHLILSGWTVIGVGIAARRLADDVRGAANE